MRFWKLKYYEILLKLKYDDHLKREETQKKDDVNDQRVGRQLQDICSGEKRALSFLLIDSETQQSSNHYTF